MKRYRKKIVAATLPVLMAILIVGLCKTSAFRQAEDYVGLRIVEAIADMPIASSKSSIALDACELKAVNSCRMLADSVKRNPSILRDTAAISSLVAMFGADELHIINRSGIIEYSNVDSLLGYDMKSSPQSDKFMPAVLNPSFEYVQEPCRRGADGLCFVYVGVSRMDTPGIVQIGYRMEQHYCNSSSRALSALILKK